MTKFSPEIVKELCALRSKGMTQKACAAMVGISEKTLSRWIQKSANAKSGAYFEFGRQWAKATAEYQLVHLTFLSQSQDWRCRKYLLEISDDSFIVERKIKADTSAKVEAKGELSNLQKFQKMMDERFGPCCPEQEK